MKTKAFIEKVRDLGYSVQLEITTQFKWLNITIDDDDLMERDKQVARIATAWEAWGTLNDMQFSGHNEIELLNVITEYLVTPLEERKEEKKYYVKLKNEVLAYNMHGSHLNFSKVDERYLFSNQELTRYYTSIFTQKEIDNFPDEVKEILPLCKQIEVTP